MIIQSTIAQFQLQTSWLINALDNISEKESNMAFSDEVNPVKWIAGHLLDTRTTILNLATGQQHISKYKSFFGKGTTFQSDLDYPSLDEIKHEWLSSEPKLLDALRNMSEEKLSSAPPFQTSIPSSTLEGLMAFFPCTRAFTLVNFQYIVS